MRLITNIRLIMRFPYTLAQRLYRCDGYPNLRNVLHRRVVRGYHVYKPVRTPLLGEHPSVRPETGNNHDKYAVSVVKHGEIVGNFPRELLRTVWHFILHGDHVTCEVTGKRKLGNGLEVTRIHCKMFFVSREIFCWFGINYFHCQSRTSHPSASLPSCNFFTSPLELEPFHLTSAAAVLPRNPCLLTTRTMIKKIFGTC